MPELKYKTRSMSDPKGKPRVYFCCHPQDFDKYFESISDEILNKQNCAIWYPEDRSMERNDEYMEDLKQMQLFVVPVTTALLCTDNFVVSLEIPFALEQHIPILPLMQESGLEELFNRKCGELQFLGKYNRDLATISYDEKLEKYLSSVLIGDKLAERIRSAFDAYVFLSYRKKDRKYAQELMRLIHKNEFCRDIAIWYDEFLIPGENFNDSIKDALIKSELFILTVTPNLVNEVNYVMTTEYPMARQEKKEILPVEVVPTNPEELQLYYKGLHSCIDAYNKTEMDENLLKVVKRIVTKENNNSPEHNFFIGLAYLNGIDVEVDYTKALELINGSADDGLVEAMDKLNGMYRNGIGVTRDYHKAVYWLEKKVEKMKAEYAQYGTEAEFYKLFEAIKECGDSYFELGKLNVALDYYEKAIQLDEKWNKEFVNHKSQYERSIIYERIANVYVMMGNFEDAIKNYSTAIKWGHCVYRLTEVLISGIQLVELYKKIASVSVEIGRLKIAAYYGERGVKLSEELCEETMFAGRGILEAKRCLSLSCCSMGEVRKAVGDLSGAELNYKKGVKLSEEIYEEMRTLKTKQDLRLSYRGMGNLQKVIGNLKGATLYYEKELKFSEELYKETETLEAKRELSLSCLNMGKVQKEMGNLSKAVLYHEKAIKLNEEVNEETGIVEIKRDLGINYCGMGDVQKDIGNLNEAVFYYEKAIKLSEEVNEETGIVEIKLDLSINYRGMGDVQKDMGNLSEAITYYKRSADLILDMHKKKKTAKSWDALAETFYRYALIDDFRRVPYLKKALFIYEKLYEKCPQIKYYKDKYDIIYSLLY